MAKIGGNYSMCTAKSKGDLCGAGNSSALPTHCHELLTKPPEHWYVRIVVQNVHETGVRIAVVAASECGEQFVGDEGRSENHVWQGGLDGRR